MRADMKKVLTERPRLGCTESYKRVRRRENSGELDDLPCHQGIRRPHRDRKNFNDLTSPLVRFLEGCVGRKWDDVWSEICSVLSPRSLMDNHLRDHVGFAVETKVFVADDKLLALGRYSGPREPWGLYVDPRDGILRRNDRKLPHFPNPIVIDGMGYNKKDGILYPVGSTYRYGNGRYPLKMIGRDKAMQIDGVWYWIDMAETPEPVDVPYYRDGKLLVRRVYSPRLDFVKGEYVQEGRYHASKRQMCSRDLRRHGLRND